MDSEAFSGRRHGGLWAAVLLVVTIVVVFGRVYDYGFLVWDDEQHVLQNPYLNPVTGGSLADLWRQPHWRLYVPLSYTWFAAEASLARRSTSPLSLGDGQGEGSAPNPMVFHLGNLALHAACALLVFIILWRLVGHVGAAFCGALLFAVHPVQVESVAWISEARGLLCAFFSLVAIDQYLRYVACSRRPLSPMDATPGAGKSATGVASYILATGALVLALLSKPAAVAVPLVVAVLDWGWLRRGPARVLWGVGPWLALAAGWGVLTKWQQPDALLPWVPPLWARPLLAGDALAFYLYKLVAPLGLGPDYGRTPAWVMEQGWFYYLWLLPAALVVALACLRQRRVWLVAAGIFTAWLLPVLGLVAFDFQRISTVADRYLYLALLGPALAVSWLLAPSQRAGGGWLGQGAAKPQNGGPLGHRFALLQPPQRWTVVPVAAMLCLLGALSFHQASYWRDNAALLGHALGVNPQSVMANHNCGFLLAREGNHREAIGWYRRGLQHHPQCGELHRSLGLSLVALGEVNEGLTALREAVRISPHQPLEHCYLANALAEQGDTDEAIGHYQTAVDLDGDCGPAYLAWGAILFARGDIEGAIEKYRRALRAMPRSVEAHTNLGVALQAADQMAEAEYHLRAALKLRPDSALAHYNLANLLASCDAPGEAARHYRLAIARDPRHARARVNLGTVLLQQGRSGEAVEEFRAALRLLPPESELAGRVREMMRPYEEP